MKLLSLALLAIFCAAGQEQSVHELFGSDQFHRAYTQASGVTFEPFQELAWEAKARAALPWLNLDLPTAPQIARLSTSESAGPLYRFADFNAPLDPAVRRATYLLIHAAGVLAIQPIQLRGTANFFFDADMTAVTHNAFTGTVAAQPSQPVSTAAFVVLGKPSDVKDPNPAAKFEKRPQEGPAVYDFTGAGRTVTWTASSKEPSEAASAFAFRLGGEKLLLVKWTRELCQSSYTLFSIGASLKPVASNDYDCDP